LLALLWIVDVEFHRIHLRGAKQQPSRFRRIAPFDFASFVVLPEREDAPVCVSRLVGVAGGEVLLHPGAKGRKALRQFLRALLVAGQHLADAVWLLRRRRAYHIIE
jgi:hypothetical protein